MDQHPISRITETKAHPTCNRSICDFCFSLFFTLNTTLTAQLFLQGHANPPPDIRLRRRKYITLGEIKGFIACLLNSIIIKRPEIASCRYTSKLQYTACFHDMFSRNNFQFNLKLYHLTDKQKPYESWRTQGSQSLCQDPALDSPWK